VGFFVFIGVIVAGVIAVLATLTLSRRRRGPRIPLTRIAIAAGEVEAQQWKGALRAAGVWCQLIGETATVYPSSGMDQELWVRANDAEKARAVLGLD
jgi:hypothetical protein